MNDNRMDARAIKLMCVTGIFKSLVAIVGAAILLYGLKLFIADAWFMPVLVIASLVVIVYAICEVCVYPYFRYRFFSYRLDGEALRINQGVFVLEKIWIPYFRIQNVKIYEGFFMRLFGLSALYCYTASGQYTVAYLDKTVAQKLKLRIQAIEHTQKQEDGR